MVNRGPDGRRTNAAGLILTAVVFSLSAMAARECLAQPAEDLGEQVQSLIGQLKAEDPEARAAAADALVALTPPEGDPETFAPAIPALIEALEDEDANVRASVVRALGTIVWRTRSGSGSEPAIPLLIDALLQDADPNVRGHAARTLGCIGRHVENEEVLRPAIQPLTHALGDEAKYDASAPSEARLEYEVSGQAAVALAMIAPRVQDEVALALAIPLLIQRLKHPDGATRWAARWVLRQVAIAAQDEAAVDAAI